MIDAVVRAVPSVGRLVGLGAQQQAVDGTTTATHIEGMEALQQGGGREDDHFEDEHLTESEIRMKEEELTFYSSKHNDHGDDNIWGLLSGVGGNVYEWYLNQNLHERTGRKSCHFLPNRLYSFLLMVFLLLLCCPPPLHHLRIHIYLVLI